MDINTFYAVTAATCFTLVGLWWSVVKDHPEWMKDQTTKQLAGGVYASFLIPALMSMGAQIGGQGNFIWNTIFVIAGVVGIRYSTKLIQQTKEAAANGPFTRNDGHYPFCMALSSFLPYSPAALGSSG